MNNARFKLMEADVPLTDRLSRKMKTALLSVDLTGLSYEDAASSLSVPIGTVKSRVHRARASIVKMRLESPASAPETQNQKRIEIR